MHRDGASIVRNNFPASLQPRRKRLTRALYASILHALFLILLCPLSARAQVSASLSGIVTDPSGAPLPAAAGTTKNLEPAAVANTVTDDAGRYQVDSLPLGQS